MKIIPNSLRKSRYAPNSFSGLFQPRSLLEPLLLTLTSSPFLPLPALTPSSLDHVSSRIPFVFGRFLAVMDLNLYQRQIIASKQYLIVWTTLMYWDWFILFSKEYRYIIKARWTPLKVAYLLK